MSYPGWLQRFTTIRIVSYFLPPLGILLLWKSKLLTRKRKILSTVYISVYFFTLIFCVLTAMVAIYGWHTRFLEWRGGYIPMLTLQKTEPNYDRLEASRQSQAQAQATPQDWHGIVTAYWTGFRGPNRDGIYAQQPILTNWPANGLRELWREPVGGGYSSFSVAEGRAYTIEQRRDKEVAAAYSEQTGRELWTNSWDAHFDEGIGGDGPRSTPTYDDGRIYALGGTGELRCLDAASGKLIWHHDIVAENGGTVLAYGTAFSPLVMDDKVIVVPGGGNKHSVVAYEKKTGKLLWKSLDEKQAYVSPMLVDLAGEKQLLVVSTFHAMGLSPENGKLLWEFPWRVQNDNVIAQPVLFATNRFLLSGGYGAGCVAVEISKASDGFSAKELWRNQRLKNKFTSSVFCKGYIYGLDEDILVCLDPLTGERKWKEGRYGYGQLSLASDHLVILSATGQLALVKAIPERYEEVAKFQALQGKTWNHPALADGKVFVRNAAEMACFDIGAK